MTAVWVTIFTDAGLQLGNAVLTVHFTDPSV